MERPWVKPEQIKEYSTSSKVKKREEVQLSYDIAKAEKYVIYYTNNKFDAEEFINKLPKDVIMAVILLAESYAVKAINGTMSSETFDDYSYTINKDTNELENLGIGPLLEDYIIEKTKGKIVMKLRKL